MSQLIIGFTTEGTTDTRFLESVIQRTFELIAFDCDQDVEVLPLITISKNAGPFVEQIMQGSEMAFDQGVMVLCVHTDADDNSDRAVFENKILPLMEEMQNHKNDDFCSNLVPVVPVHMSEAWMLADIELIKSEIGTDLRNFDLGLHRAPETIADPKYTIEEAIRIARQNLPKKRRNDLTIGELYQPIGQKLGLDTLERLPSFQKFYQAVRQAYRTIKYLH